MRKRALRLLLLGPKSHFWRHGTRPACATIPPRQGLCALGNPDAAGEFASSAAAAQPATSLRPPAPADAPPPTPPLPVPPSLPLPLQRQSAVTCIPRTPSGSELPAATAAVPIVNSTTCTTRCIGQVASSLGSVTHCRTASTRSPVPHRQLPSPAAAAAAAAAAPTAAAAVVAAVTKSRARASSTSSPRSLDLQLGTRFTAARADDGSTAARDQRDDASHPHGLLVATVDVLKPSRGGSFARPETRVQGCLSAATAATAATAAVATATATTATAASDLLAPGRGSAAATATCPELNGHREHISSDLLAEVRQAALSRDARLRRRAAEQLLAWARGRQEGATEPFVAASAAALPAAAATELAVLCPELALFDRVVWDILLRRVAAEAVNAAATTAIALQRSGPKPGSESIPESGSEPRSCAKDAWPGPTSTGWARGSVGLGERGQRRAAVALAWEVALVVHAAAACGQAAHPQLVVLQQALATLAQNCLPPSWLSQSSSRTSRTNTSRTSSVVDGGGPSQEQLEHEIEGATWQAGAGHGPDGVLGLAALLHAAGELWPPPLPLPPQQTLLQAARPMEPAMALEQQPAAVVAADRARAVLMQPGTLEAALQELLAMVQQPPPYPVGGVLAGSALGAAASLRTALLGWRLLLADKTERCPPAVAVPPAPPAAAAAATGGAAAATIAKEPPQKILPKEDFVQHLACFVQSCADRLLPEARGGGGGGSSASRAVQQVALAWRSSPDLHRHLGLSRAVWDALPATAALVEPGVPWVEAARMATAATSDSWVTGAGPSSAAAPAVTPALTAPAPTAAAVALLTELCRLAAGTFYGRMDPISDADVGSSPNSVCVTRHHCTRSSSSSSSSSSNLRGGTYIPNADNLLLLVRAAVAMRGQTAATAAAATVTTGSDCGQLVDATAARRSVLTRSSSSLEAIILATTSAYLRRVTGLLAWEGQLDRANKEEGQEAADYPLGLPAAALLTEFLTRHSRIPDWHVIWRLIRHQNAAVATADAAAAEPVSSLPQMVDGAWREAAAWASRGAAATAELVLRSSEEDLQRWCWPRTAIRLAVALAESAWRGSPDTGTAASEDGHAVAVATAATAAAGNEPLAAAAASERLLLHAAPAALTAAECDDMATALAWLRSATVLELCRRHVCHGGSSGDGPVRHALSLASAVMDSEVDYGDCGGSGGGDEGEGGPLQTALAAVAKRVEAQLLRMLEHCKHLQRVRRHAEAAAADAIAVSPDWFPSGAETDSLFGRTYGSSYGSSNINSSSSVCSSDGDGLRQGFAWLEENGAIGTVLGAIGELLEADAGAAGYLPANLTDACLQVLGAIAVDAAAPAAELRIRKDDPWIGRLDLQALLGKEALASGGGGGSGGAGHGSSGGGHGGGGDNGEALRGAAAQALVWLAGRRQVAESQLPLLSPLLAAVTAPMPAPPAAAAVVAAVAAGIVEGASQPDVRGAGMTAKVPCWERQGGRQPQQQLAAALLAVMRLAAAAPAPAAEELEGTATDAAALPLPLQLKLQDAARWLTECLRRGPSERLPLHQLAALCGALTRLGLMDAHLLLHLTQRQRREHQRRWPRRPNWRPGTMWSFPYNATTAGGGNGLGSGTAAAAIAAAQMLSLASVLLCPAPPLLLPLAPAPLGRASEAAARVRAATVAATSMPLSRDQLVEAAAGLGSWLVPIISRGVTAAPPTELLLTAWCAAHDLAAIADDGSGGSGSGRAVPTYTSANSWLAELGSAITRRLLERGLDGLLLHQLASLPRCLAQPAVQQQQQQQQRRDEHLGKDLSNLNNDLNEPSHSSRPATASDRRHTKAPPEATKAAAPRTARPAVAAAAVAAATSQQGGGSPGRWLPRWLRPQLGRSAHPAIVEPEYSATALELARGPSRLGGDGGDGGGGNTTEAVSPLPAAGGSQSGDGPARAEQLLREQVQEALLRRTLRHGDAYEAPADVVCGALRDLAAVGALRASPLLAASIVDGLVFRLADDASADGLAAVAAALAAGGTDPWVTHCGARGLFEELSRGLQRWLRLQPDEVTTAHLMVMAADMYDVATAAAGGGGIAGTGTANLLDSAGVLRVLSRALATRAEQLWPEQALAVAVIFSSPRLRNSHLLQRLTEVAAAVSTAPATVAAAAAPVSERLYTAEQLLRLAECMFSGGLRDQQLFAPLVRALRARAEAPSGTAMAAAAGDDSAGKEGAGLDARTLQAAVALLRALRLNADADALQQAFVRQVRRQPSSPPRQGAPSPRAFRT